VIFLSHMKITHEQAAEMYARACRAWYGPRAKGIVRKKIKQLYRFHISMTWLCKGMRLWI